MNLNRFRTDHEILVTFVEGDARFRERRIKISRLQFGKTITISSHIETQETQIKVRCVYLSSFIVIVIISRIFQLSLSLCTIRDIEVQIPRKYRNFKF